MNPSLEWYRVFHAVCIHRSISAAAQSLHISQPAVSQSIRQLEQSIGCTLFNRQPRGVALTAEGELLFPYVEEGISRIALGERKLAEQLNFEYGEIRIGASDMTLQYFLLPHLERFHQKYPKIKVSVTNGPTPETVALLKQNRIDFAVVTQPVDAGEFQAFPVRPIDDIFVCSPGFNIASPVPLETLAANPLILLEKNTSTRRYLDSFFTKHGLELQPEIELATSSLIVQFAVRGFGIGCVVRDFALDAIRAGELIELTLDTPIPPRSMCLLKGPVSYSRISGVFLESILP